MEGTGKEEVEAGVEEVGETAVGVEGTVGKGGRTLSWQSIGPVHLAPPCSPRAAYAHTAAGSSSIILQAPR